MVSKNDLLVLCKTLGITNVKSKSKEQLKGLIKEYEESNKLNVIASGKKIKYIFHTADIHIRTLDRHTEYSEVFENLYRKLNEYSEILSESVFVICGDLFHNRDRLISETILLFNKFIENLTNIIDVVIILGNHDVFTHNDRLDIMSGIVNIKAYPNFYFLKDTGVYCYHNINFVVSSLLDNRFIRANEIPRNENINIALYHGAITGSKLDNNMTIQEESSRLKLSDFKGYDYVLLGDIHKRQNLTERVSYPGSLIQQNFKEEIIHGILKWDLVKGSNEFIPIKNNYSYITIDLNKGNDMSEYKFTPKSRIKLLHDYKMEVNYEEIKKEISKETSILSINKEIKVRGDMEIINNEGCKLEETRESLDNKLFKNLINNEREETKNKLIDIHTEYLKKYTLNDDNMQRDCDSWYIKELEFKNMYIYGDDHVNKINFEDMKGVIGLIEQNATGKCLGENTEVLMYDGSIKMCQNIKPNDLVMGDDSQPRKVLNVTSGESELYEVFHYKTNEKYIVNKYHILTLKYMIEYNIERTIDISIQDYLKLDDTVLGKMLGYKVPVQFSYKDQPFDAYIIGVYIGNGYWNINYNINLINYLYENNITYSIYIYNKPRINIIKDGYTGNYYLKTLNTLGIIESNKCIPCIYKYNSEGVRLKLLAGILDCKGYKVTDNYYEIYEYNDVLADDIVYVCNSLGFYVSNTRRDRCNRIVIMGDNLYKIPMLSYKKARIVKEKINNEYSYLYSDIKVRSIGKGRYYGFQVNDNGRFLLGNFIVTHNSSIMNTIFHTLFGNMTKNKSYLNRNIINKKSNSYYSRMVIKLQNNEEEYTILRTGKNKTRKNNEKSMEESLSIFRNEINITDSNKVITQDKIKKELGLSNKDLFILTNVMNYSNYISLLNMTSNDISNVFSQLFDLEHYKLIYTDILKKMKDINEDIKEMNGKKLVLEEQLREPVMEEELNKVNEELEYNNKGLEITFSKIEKNIRSIERLKNDVIKLEKIDEEEANTYDKQYNIEELNLKSIKIKSEMDIIKKSIEDEESRINEIIFHKLKKPCDQKEYMLAIKYIEQYKYTYRCIENDYKIDINGDIIISEDTWKCVVSILNDTEKIERYINCIKLKDEYEEYTKLLEENNIMEDEYKRSCKKIKELSNSNDKLSAELEDILKIIQILDNIKIYKENKENINKQKELNNNRKSLENDKIKFQNEIKLLIREQCNIKLLLEQQSNYKSQLNEIINKISILENKLEIYKKYKGIVNDKTLPKLVLSSTISKVEHEANIMIYTLAGLCICISNEQTLEGSRWEIIIKKNNMILGSEQISGYERFIINIGIKMALDKYKFYSGSNIFFIDEAFDCVSEENLEKIDELFDYLKSYYRNILIISHNEELKKKIDHRIRIESDFVSSRLL